MGIILPNNNNVISNNRIYHIQDIPYNQVKPIPIQKLEIIMDQMKNYICKISRVDGELGSGFFCKIPFPDQFHLLPVLFTCNHLLNENNIKNGQIIKFRLSNNTEKTILIDDTTKRYTNKELDTTIIEIKEIKVKIDERDVGEIINFLGLMKYYMILKEESMIIIT